MFGALIFGATMFGAVTPIAPLIETRLTVVVSDS